MDKRICHQGVIESIDGNRAYIRTLRSSACDTCDASGSCHSNRGNKFRVDVTDDRLAGRKPGDRVVLEMPVAAGRQAVFVGFGLPLVLFVAVLLGMHYAGFGDDCTVLVSIGVLVVYYIIIYMLRGLMDRHFKIRIVGD